MVRLLCSAQIGACVHNKQAAASRWVYTPIPESTARGVETIREIKRTLGSVYLE